MRQDIKIPAGSPGQKEFCCLRANYRGRGSHTIVVPKGEYHGTDRLERVAGGGGKRHLMRNKIGFLYADCLDSI